MASRKQQIGIYLVDVSGSMSGDRLNNCKKFIASMTSDAAMARFIVYTYGDSPVERNYESFKHMSAGGGTMIEHAVNQMFTVYLPKEKENLVDFVLLTDAEDNIRDLSKLKANIAGCRRQYGQFGGKLDLSAVFVLSGGTDNETSLKVKDAFGGGDVFDTATMDKKLKETEQGLKQCNNARAVYMECQEQIEDIKRNLLSSLSPIPSSKNDETGDEKDEKKEEIGQTPTVAITEKVEKELNLMENDMKELENDLVDILPADILEEIFLDDIDGDVVDGDGGVNELQLQSSDPLESELLKLSMAMLKKRCKDQGVSAQGGKMEMIAKIMQQQHEQQQQQQQQQQRVDDEKSASSSPKPLATSASDDSVSPIIYIEEDEDEEVDEKQEEFSSDNDNAYGMDADFDEEKFCQSIRDEIEKANPFEKDPKSDAEMKEEENKMKLIGINQKLQEICNSLDINIDELKQLLVAEMAVKTTQSAVAKFADLEALLNNISIKSVQSKVESMKEDLRKAKEDILRLEAELEAKQADQHDVNEKIEKLEGKKARVQKMRSKVKKGITGCDKAIGDEVKRRKENWKGRVAEEQKKEILKKKDLIIEKKIIQNAKLVINEEKTQNHSKNRKLLSMLFISKLNITITSATDSKLIFWRKEKNKMKPVSSMSIPGKALFLRCSADEKYLVAGCNYNKTRKGLIIVWQIGESLETVKIVHLIRSKGNLKFRRPNAIEISDDNRFLFYSELSSKISVIDLSQAKASKVAEIRGIGFNDIITSMSVSRNLLIFGGETGLIGAFFLCLLRQKRTIKQVKKNYVSKYFGITCDLKRPTKQVIADVGISGNERFLSVCGKRKVQSFAININEKQFAILKKLCSKKTTNDKQLQNVMKIAIELKENAKIAANHGKKLIFDKYHVSEDRFCICNDEQNKIGLKVYSLKNYLTEKKKIGVIGVKAKNKSFCSQIQFTDKIDQCIVAFQTKTNKKYNAPKLYVWEYTK